MSWDRLGASWAGLCVLLGVSEPLGAVLGSSCTIPGLSWGGLWASWGSQSRSKNRSENCSEIRSDRVTPKVAQTPRLPMFQSWILGPNGAQIPSPKVFVKRAIRVISSCFSFDSLSLPVSNIILHISADPGAYVRVPACEGL